LLGHSTGGVISCVYTLGHQTKLAGLICESFAHQLPAPDIALAVLKGLSHIVPNPRPQSGQQWLLTRS
jgi:acylglycerol lipase